MPPGAARKEESVSYSPKVYKSRAGYEALMAWYDAALERLAVPHEVITIDTRYGETHVIAAGPSDRLPVVFLHGWNGNSMMWEHQIPIFAKEYRVYAPDTIGQVGKSAPVRPSQRGPGYAEWLVDLLDALVLDQASFVGISGGAWLTLKLATLAVERISKAVLLSAAGFTPPTARFMLRALAMASAMTFAPTQAASQFGRLPKPPGQPVNSDFLELFDLLISHQKNQQPPVVLSDGDLKKLTAPTLLLMGQYEAVLGPQAVLAKARSVLPNLVSAEIIPDAGHDLISDRPNVVNERLLKFLAETR
jgi:pimeloyl-ACP methyl ester carboxylesterase